MPRLARPLVWVIAALVLTALLAAPAPSARAATRTWSGAGANANWTNAANWGGTAPAVGDKLTFPANAARLTNTNDFAANTAFDSILFTGGGYTITGATVSLTNGVEVNTASADTNTLSLIIAGAGGVKVGGGGTLALTRINTFNGNVTVDSGTLHITSAGALGSATGYTQISHTATTRGDLEIEGSFFLNEIVKLDNSEVALIHVISGQSQITPGITVGFPLSSIDVAVSASLTLAGPTTGGDLSKTGGGTLLMNGTSKGWYVTDGTLELNNAASGAVHLVHGSLTGNGSAASFDSVAGTVGNPPALGGLTINGTMKLDADSTFTGEINGPSGGSQYSQIATSGQPTLGNAALELTVTHPGPKNTSYTILNNTSNQPVVGTFFGLAEGAQLTLGSYTFRITYKGGTGNNDVVLLLQDISPADLDIPVVNGPEPVAAGSNVTYAFSARNNTAGSTPNSVIVEAKIGTGSSFVSFADNDVTCTTPAVGATGTVHCTIPELTVPTIEFTLVVKITAGRTAPVIATFTIAADNPDPTPANNTSTVTSHIGATSGSPGTNRRYLPQVAVD